MREGNTQRRDVIRYLRSALGNRQIELRRELTDEDVVAVIRTQIKQSSDASDIFRSAERLDLAEKEEAQVAILREYLPEQMSEEELTLVVRNIAEEHQLSGPGDMGKLMPKVMEQVGDKAEGRTISKIAREVLSQTS